MLLTAATLLLSLHFTTSSPPVQRCTQLECGEVVQGRCFYWSLERKRCVCAEQGFIVDQATAFKVSFSLRQTRKFNDVLYLEDAETGRLLRRMDTEIVDGGHVVVTLTGRIRVRLSSQPAAGGDGQCVPGEVFRQSPKGRRKYSMNITISPLPCPPISADLGCGQRVERRDESMPGQRVAVTCGCPGHRSAVGPDLVCMSGGKWSADVTDGLCRAAPHPLRLVAILDVVATQTPAIAKMRGHVDAVRRYLDLANRNDSRGDKMAVVYYSGDRVKRLPDEITSGGPLPAISIGKRQARKWAFIEARRQFIAWSEDDADASRSSHSAMNAIVVLSRVRKRDRLHQKDQRSIRKTLQLTQRQYDTQVFMLELGFEETRDNELRRVVVSHPFDMYHHALVGLDTPDAQHQVMVNFLNTLTPPCIRLACNQTKYGSCAFILAGRPACLDASVCDGYRFVNVDGHALAAQMYSALLDGGDQLVVRQSVQADGGVAFRCSGVDCQTGYDVTVPKLIPILQSSRAPSFRPGLLTAWSGSEIMVQMSPDEPRERPCYETHPGNQELSWHTVDVAITAVECAPRSRWDAKNGTIAMPRIPTVGSKIVLSCHANNTVASGMSAITECVQSRDPSQPPTWSQSSFRRPVCSRIQDGEKTCPLPKLPLFSKMELSSGSDRYRQGIYRVQCVAGYEMICDNAYCPNGKLVQCSAHRAWEIPNWDRNYCEEINPERLAGLVRRRFDLFKASDTKRSVCSVVTDVKLSHATRAANASTATGIPTTIDPTTPPTPTTPSVAETTETASSSNAAATAPSATTSGEEERLQQGAGQREREHGDIEEGDDVVDDVSVDGALSCGFQSRKIEHVGACMELAFLLDDSKSMSGDDFGDALNFVRQIVTTFGTRLRDEERDGVRIALMTFSNGAPRLHIRLENGTEYFPILETLETIRRMPGDTNIRLALQVFIDEVVPHTRFACDQRLLFVITDGDTNAGGDGKTLKELARRVREEERWEIYSIGIKNSRFRKDILESLVSAEQQADHLYIMQTGQFQNVTRSLIDIKGVNYSRCGVDNIFGRDGNGSTHHSGPVRPSQYPWMAGIFVNRSGDPITLICGGSLVKNAEFCDRPAYILTAAHCFSGLYAAEDLLVRLGDTIFSVNEGTEEVYGVEYLTVHNRYRGVSLKNPTPVNDVALLKLKREPILGPAIRPICLPHSTDDWNEELPVDSAVVSSGWGVEKSAERNKIFTNSDYLKAVNLYTAGDPICKKQMRAPTGTVCAHNPYTFADTCLGDSGGPLMRRRRTPMGGDKQRTWFVAGVLSYGPPPEEGTCNVPGKFSVYTKLTDTLLRWVNDRMQSRIVSSLCK